MFGIMLSRDGSTVARESVPADAEVLREGPLTAYASCADGAQSWVFEQDGDVVLGDGHLFAGPRAAWQRLREEGPSTLQRLGGEFALAWWERGSQRVVAGSDLVGTRPLYYACNGAHISVGDDPRWVLRGAGIEPCLDASRLRAWCCGELGDGAPPLQHIGAVPSGRWLLADERGVAMAGGITVEDCPKTFTADELAAQLRQRLEQVVDEHLRGTERVSVHLTGGVDSSSLVGLACTRLPTVEVTPVVESFPGEATDETAHAQRAAAHFCLTPRIIRADNLPPAAAPSREWAGAPGPTLLWHGLSPAGLNVKCQDARRLGITRMFSGDGADMLLRSGPGEYHRPSAGVAASVRWLGSVDARVWAELLAREELAVRAPRMLAGLRALRRSPPWLLGELPHSAPMPIWSRNPRTNTRARMLLGDVGLRLGIQFQVRLAANAGIDLRFPYLDSGLIAWALRVPPLAFAPRPQAKWLLRRAVADLLPADTRSSTGSGIAAKGLFLLEKGRDATLALLARRSIRELRLVDPTSLMRAYDRAIQGIPAPHLLSTLHTLIWLETWQDESATRGLARGPDAGS